MPRVPLYLRLPPAEAIAYFRNKLAIPTEHSNQVDAEFHDFAYTVSGLSRADLLDSMDWLIDQSLAEGTSFEDFNKQFDRLVARRGWSPTPLPAGPADWRMRIIFETPIRRAYGAGRRKQMLDPDVVARRPYWMWKHGDSMYAPRPNHLRLHNKVFDANHHFWDIAYPMCAYGCKCRVFTLSERRMRQMGARVETPPDPYTIAERGFQRAPGASAEDERREVLQRGIERLSPDLQQQVQNDLAERGRLDAAPSQTDDPKRSGYTWVDDKTVKGGGFWRKVPGMHKPARSKRSRDVVAAANPSKVKLKPGEPEQNARAMTQFGRQLYLGTRSAEQVNADADFYSKQHTRKKTIANHQQTIEKWQKVLTTENRPAADRTMIERWIKESEDAITTELNAGEDERQQYLEVTTRTMEKLHTKLLKTGMPQPEAEATAKRYLYWISDPEVAANTKEAATRFLQLTGKNPRTLKKFFVDENRELPYADPDGRSIHIGKGRFQKAYSIYHEMGHHVEFSHPEFQKAAVAWRTKRQFSDRSLEPIPGHEEALWHPGQFIHNYIGRIYPGSDDTEVFTMGIQCFTQPINMAKLYMKDREYFFFVLGAMRSEEPKK